MSINCQVSAYLSDCLFNAKQNEKLNIVEIFMYFHEICSIRKVIQYLEKKNMKLTLIHFRPMFPFILYSQKCVKTSFSALSSWLWGTVGFICRSWYTFFHKQTVYKQLALGLHIFEQLSRLNALSLSNKKTTD